MNAPARTETRPQMVQPGDDGKKPQSINDLMRHPATIQKMSQIVPKHLSGDRMLRVLAQAIFKVPKLAECNPMSLLGTSFACGALGLEPNTPLGHAYLIPFEVTKWNPQKKEREYVRTDVQLVIGYRGYIDLARRSGSLVSIHADVVYRGDEFSFEYGSNMHLRHVPQGARGDRTKDWAYSHAKLTDGEAFEVLPYAEVLRIRDGAQSYRSAVAAKAAAEKKGWKVPASYTDAPWIKFEHEQASKTLVRRLAKWLPMSIEYQTAVALDTAGDVGAVDYSKLVTADVAGFDPAAALTHDPGEEFVGPGGDEGGEEEGEPVPAGNRTPEPEGRQAQQQGAGNAAQQQRGAGQPAGGAASGAQLFGTEG